MNGYKLNVMIDKSGSMHELGKQALASQIKSDLEVFFDVKKIDSSEKAEDGRILWITDGYGESSSVGIEVYKLLIGCDHLPSVDDDNSFMLEEFPLLIERLSDEI